MKNYKKIFFFLAFLFGILLLSLSYDIRPIIFQGDHGRDLHAFMATAQGQMVYRDYWWVYGPLMPYYYAAFFKLLGFKITSIVIGQTILNIISGLFIYLSLARFINPIIAFFGALWYLSFFPGFFYTFNHSGAVMLSLGGFYFFLRYLNNGKNKNLLIASLFFFITSFVKLNIGLIGAAALMLCVFISDLVKKVPITKDKKVFYGVTALLLPLLSIFVYWLMLKGMPIHEIRQCLPYLKADHPHNASLLTSLMNLGIMTFKNIFHSWPTMLFAGLIWLSIFQIITMYVRKRIDKEDFITIPLIMGSLVIFYVAYMHEFLASTVFYRSHWSKPFSFLMIYFAIGFGMKKFSYLVRLFVYAGIILVISAHTSSQFALMTTFKTPNRYLALDRARVFVGNTDTWMNTITDTTRFLESNLKEGETFFALPYEPIYHYLTDRKLPTRQTIFFDHINIPEEQERKVIADLERHHVNYILISNRAMSEEAGLGRFGTDYCPLLYKYVEENFDHIETFGRWVMPSMPTWYHAIRVFKRK